MKVTFIGQQSWAIQSDGAFVLIDPVLTGSFGSSKGVRFDIWPRRTVDLERMPRVDAVVVTNEHLDHFDLRSLLMLPTGTDVIVGELTPACCIDAMNRAGLHVRLAADRQQIAIRDLLLSLYQCSSQSAPWERRVYHAVVTSTTAPHSLFIQSDGLLSDALLADVATGLIPPPSFFIATNNAQVPPPEAVGTYANLLGIDAPDNEGPYGIRIFKEVLCSVVEGLGHVPHIAYCGGGYVQSPAKHGPFLLNDPEKLQECFDSLSLGQKVHVSTPADTYILTSHKSRLTVQRERANWIRMLESVEHIETNPNWFDASVFEDFASEDLRKSAIVTIEDELRSMAPILLGSQLGRMMTSCHVYINGPTGEHRFAIRFYETSSGHVKTAALNINRCRFDWIDLEADDVICTVPFGIDVHLADFWELTQGGLQIWELATARMRQWYVGTDRMCSPLAFLYSYFSEQIRQDLATKMYDRILSESLERE